MPAPTKTCSSRPTPPWRPHNRNSPPQQGKGGNAAAAMTPACPKPTKNQSYAEPVQLSRPEYPSQSPTHHADTQISPITLKSSASKTPREKSGIRPPHETRPAEKGHLASHPQKRLEANPQPVNPRRHRRVRDDCLSHLGSLPAAEAAGLHGTTESLPEAYVRRALEFDSKCSPIVCQSGIFANRWRIKTPPTH